jgi:hypothetical protein
MGISQVVGAGIDPAGLRATPGRLAAKMVDGNEA